MHKFSPTFHVIEKPITGSTNDDAIALAAEGAPHFTVVWAHTQTAGRGRFNRKWLSDVGNLYFTVIVRLAPDSPPVEQLAFIAALAAAEASQKTITTPSSVAIKWPNDVLIADKKTSGILIEGDISQGWYVVGIGINVKLKPNKDDVFYEATCLQDHSVSELSTHTVLELFLTAFENLYSQWLKNAGFSGALLDLYQTLAWRVGQDIAVSIDANRFGTKHGINRGIDHMGRLLIQNPNGVIETISAADVLLHPKTN